MYQRLDTKNLTASFVGVVVVTIVVSNIVRVRVGGSCIVAIVAACGIVTVGATATSSSASLSGESFILTLLHLNGTLRQ